MPNIQRAFARRSEEVQPGPKFERKLPVTRRFFAQPSHNASVPSLSSHKGMFLAAELRRFYLDLRHPGRHSATARVHSRFSTNIDPSRERARPCPLIWEPGAAGTRQALTYGYLVILTKNTALIIGNDGYKLQLI